MLIYVYLHNAVEELSQSLLHFLLYANNVDLILTLLQKLLYSHSIELKL